MSEKEKHTKTPLRYIRELEGYTFSIDKYQRGYRWGLREITALLEDISDFEPEHNSFYCLQPLVVKEKEEANHYELIDGQQRSTTIYLILKILLGKDFFNIKYETRGNESGVNVFLSNLNGYNIPEKDKKISEYWKEKFIKDPNIENSVDNFYFYKAYVIIKRWFASGKEEKLKNNLLNHTKVIWYQERQATKNSSKTFVNFNDGKISLDQAELIKGLFVLNFDTILNPMQKAYEENQFADEWNNIEHHLKVPSFWNFINSEKNNKSLANKITLLLQLEKGKSLKEEDLYYTYREYEKAFKSDSKPEWRNLSSLYNQLEEWFLNRDTYHLMGAVVHLTNTSIHDMIREYQNKSKKIDLVNYLKDILKKEFYKEDEFKDNYNPDLLKYGAKGITSVLLLYNIAVAHVSDTYYKFPFDLFREVRSWNIEHIHAKNTKEFETKEDLEEWKREVEEIINNKKWKREIEEIINNKKLISKEADANIISNYLNSIDTGNLQHANNIVKEVEQVLNEIFDKDNLWNLCFLDQTTNIQVGRHIFKKKREMVLEINHQLDKRAYVPIATKKVFQKALTPSNELTMNYWNISDRKAYLEDIKQQITNFLAKKDDKGI